MKHRLGFGLCAVAVLGMGSVTVAQRKPLDDPNPPWKAELSKKSTPRGEDGNRSLDADEFAEIRPFEIKLSHPLETLDLSVIEVFQ